jgi:hypothetical protein
LRRVISQATTKTNQNKVHKPHYLMKHLQITCLAAVTFILMCSGRADIVSHFDSDSEGWTATGAVLSYVATGGNPSGFLSLADQLTALTVYAPAAYTGDLSTYLGGTLSFDAKNLNGTPPNLVPNVFGTVTISGPGGTASNILGVVGDPPADGLWHPYSALLNPALWSGNLAGALGNVTELSVILESNNIPIEIIGFDNFAVIAVPEPSSVALGIIGAVSAFGACRRRTRNVA